ncbi:MAG: polyprenyl synthetase family protein [Patescibacteria group bacterium]
MDFKTDLEDFKVKFDKELKAFFLKAIQECSKRDKFITDALKLVSRNVLSGGKRVRPALMYWGYVGVGGREIEKMIRTAVSIELIHSFLLIHDDIMDRDLIRHGEDTVNYAYEKVGKRFFGAKDARHFGDSIALTIGDMVAALGNQVIFESKFEPEIIMKALSKLQDIVSLTVIGQSKDIYMEYRGKATEKEVLEMYEYKTARYTFEGPLQLGGILGGASSKTLESFSRFSIPLGIAFQIQDDILGIFGTEKEIGKSVGSDIREGKQTLLVVKALEMGNAKQKKRLRELLGSSDIRKKEVEEFRKIISDTGALFYARKMVEKLIKKGKGEIEKTAVGQPAKEFLLGMARYMIERKR